jgi:hypothetical protein
VNFVAKEPIFTELYPHFPDTGQSPEKSVDKKCQSPRAFFNAPSQNLNAMARHFALMEVFFDAEVRQCEHPWKPANKMLLYNTAGEWTF